MPKATAVRTTVPSDGPKGVSIQFAEDGRTPRFSFSGDWHGRDVHVIRANLPREYRRYQRSRVVSHTPKEVSDGTAISS